MSATGTARWPGLAGALAALLLLGGRRDALSAWRGGLAQPDSLARIESAYARAVAVLSDSAVRQRDFFPERAQVRLETALLDPREAPVVPFAALAERAADAARTVADLTERFGSVAVPPDLGAHHATVLAALRDEAGALGLLAAAATACENATRSELRCRTPLTDATVRLSRAGRRYLDARRRIRDQIADTGTELPEFTTARR